MCMYVCMYVCMHACTYVCMCVYFNEWEGNGSIRVGYFDRLAACN